MPTASGIGRRVTVPGPSPAPLTSAAAVTPAASAVHARRLRGARIAADRSPALRRAPAAGRGGDRAAAGRRCGSGRRSRAGESTVLPPQKKNSGEPGSPIGQWQVASVELQDRAALADRNDVVEEFGFRLGLRLEIVVRRRAMRERGVAAGCRPRRPHEVRGRPRLARPRRRRRGRLGAARQPEPVHLADHGVAGDAAEFGRDLAGRKAVRPQLLQQFDPLVCPRPGHGLIPLPTHAARLRLAESHHGPRQPVRPAGANAHTDGTQETVRRTRCRIRRHKTYNIA